MKSIAKQVAMNGVIFVLVILLESVAFGFPRDLTRNILVSGFPITIVATALALILIRYFKPTT